MQYIGSIKPQWYLSFGSLHLVFNNHYINTSTASKASKYMTLFRTKERKKTSKLVLAICIGIMSLVLQWELAIIVGSRIIMYTLYITINVDINGILNFCRWWFTHICESAWRSWEVADHWLAAGHGDGDGTWRRLYLHSTEWTGCCWGNS